MKRNLLSATALVLLLAGCSQNEVTDVNSTIDTRNLIGLEPTTGTTRATDAKIENLQTGGFKVFATTTGAESTKTVNIDNKEYKFNSGKWAWQDGDHEWPAAGFYPMNFYAYYPVEEFATALTLDNLATYSITVKDVDSQKDLLVAQTEVAQKPATKKASLYFKHILSKILFKAKVDAGYTVHIQSIKIQNVNNQNSFNFNTLTWSALESQGNIDYIYRKSPAIGDKTQVTITGSAADVAGTNGPLMLMPQSFVAGNAWDTTSGGLGVANANLDKAYIEVIYRLTMTNNNGAQEDVIGYGDGSKHTGFNVLTGTWKDAHPNYTDGLYQKVAYGLFPTNSWNRGKAYAYTIQYPGTGGILVDDTYYDENGVDTGLKVVTKDGSETKPGDPSISGDKDLISFSIEVDDWDEPTSKPLN